MTEGLQTAPAQSLLSRLLRLYLTIEAGLPTKVDKAPPLSARCRW